MFCIEGRCGALRALFAAFVEYYEAFGAATRRGTLAGSRAPLLLRVLLLQWVRGRFTAPAFPHLCTLPWSSAFCARAPPPPPLPRPDRAALALLRRLRPHLEAASGEGDGDGAALERAGGRNGTHAFDDDSPSRFETALEIDDGRDRSWSLDRGPKVL